MVVNDLSQMCCAFAYFAVTDDFIHLFMIFRQIQHRNNHLEKEHVTFLQEFNLLFFFTGL
jgi:hypothetical protein